MHCYYLPVVWNLLHDNVLGNMNITYACRDLFSHLGFLFFQNGIRITSCTLLGKKNGYQEHKWGCFAIKSDQGLWRFREAAKLLRGPKNKTGMGRLFVISGVKWICESKIIPLTLIYAVENNWHVHFSPWNIPSNIPPFPSKYGSIDINIPQTWHIKYVKVFTNFCI